MLCTLSFRNVPNKKGLILSVSLFGSTALALARFALGSFFPSLQQLLYNKLVLAYIGVSGAVGLAITYYYNNPENDKFNTMLKVGLQVRR